MWRVKARLLGWPSTKCLRLLSTEMSAWQIHQYGGVEQLELCSTLRMPPIVSPSDVLVRVHAASVNPLDVKMLGGYGNVMLDAVRRSTCAGGSSGGAQPEFPLILGRDFSGRVEAVGAAVKHVKPGDLVWGAPPVHWAGTHALYTVVPHYAVSLRPESLSDEQAASLAYVACTAWSALVVTSHVWPGRSLRVLVLGCSGGVGSLAVQLLSAWNCHVTATCAADFMESASKLGVDHVLDYTAETFHQQLNQLDKFDVVLDCSGSGDGASHLRLLKSWTYGKYVTLDPPLLSHSDTAGLLAGGVRSAVSLIANNVSSHTRGRSYRWAFFFPNRYALDTVSRLVEEQKVVAVVQRVVPFSQLPSAYQTVIDGPNRGKTVISMQPSQESSL